MSNIVTPALVRRYLLATSAPRSFLEMVDDGADLEVVTDQLHGQWHEARLGMLAAAEMVVAHADAKTSRDGAAFLAVRAALAATSSALVEAAGVDPIAWEKARGA